MRIANVCMLLVFLLCSEVVLAQFGTPSSLKAESEGASITFPVEPTSLASINTNRASLYKPDGNGPFPAMVLLHNCGGPAVHLERWTRAGLENGYVVLIPDSMRGALSNCKAPPQIPLGLRVRDAFEAVKYLSGLPYVNKAQIVAIGFSQGSHVAEWLTSPSVAAALAPPDTPRIAAAVAAYAFCALAPNRARPQGAIVVQDDVDTPLMVLLGGEDKESPPQSCLERLPMLKEKGAPVFWHFYPNATHGWDQQENSGRTKTDWKGERITNYYDEATTLDSVKRSMEFLRQYTMPNPMK